VPSIYWELVIRSVFACLLCGPLVAQDPPLVPSADSVRMEAARRRAAAEEERRLREKMAEFVRAWNDFVQEYTGRGAFNIRKARRITRAWRRLEREGGRPKP